MNQQNIDSMENNVEDQLKEINKKCLDLKKQENQVRRCLKKLSAASTKKLRNQTDRGDSKISKSISQDRISNGKGGSLADTSEEDYTKNMDFNQTIKSAMKNYPPEALGTKHLKKPPRHIHHNNTSYDFDDHHIIDVDAACNFEEGRWWYMHNYNLGLSKLTFDAMRMGIIVVYFQYR